MGWFDKPAIAVRKRLPLEALAEFNDVEIFSIQRFQVERLEHRDYLVGIVLSQWAKWNSIQGEFILSQRDRQKMQAVYESCVNVLKGDAFPTFLFLDELVEGDFLRGIPQGFFKEVGYGLL